MASSLFTFRYPITRAYPYKWFPWVVYIGGIIVAVFFSILNFAANGYILTVQYTKDYNKTSAQKTWAQGLSLNGKVVATCQPQNLPIHSRYYTDKLSLVYELSNIWIYDEKGVAQTLPSLQYANNHLQNCSVSEIHLTLECDDRTAAQKGWSPWGASALGVTTCLVDNQKSTWVNLTARYEFVTPEIENNAASKFVQSPQNLSVLWWGESLLSWNWLNVVRAVNLQESNEANDGHTQRALKGSIVFEPTGNSSGITSIDFFRLPNFHYTFTEYHDSFPKAQYNGVPNCCINPATSSHSIGTLHDMGAWPDAWIEADAFAKVFYSVMLADLGQQNTTTNLLADPAALALFSNNITTMKSGSVESPWLKAGPAREPYQRDDGSNLSITPSVFFTEYLCQVPTLRSAGSLVVAVLVADLVFLNAAWVLLNWFAGKGLEGSAAQQCEGCIGNGVVQLVDKGTGVQQQARRYGRLRRRHSA